jgi:adenylate kinase family enzyme
MKISNIYKINIELKDIKHLVLDLIDKAQDIRDEHYLPRCINYECWHSPLIDYYKKNKKSVKLNMPDKLAFVVLLSYPKKYIETLKNISDIKLYNENKKDDPDSDFIYKGIIEEPGSDCICSKCYIRVVHIVENKYSGIRLQVGSDCIHKSKLITNKELQKSKDAEKEYKRKLDKQKKELERLEQIRLEEEKKIKEELERQQRELEQRIKDYDPCKDCGKLEIHKSESHWRFRCIPCYINYKQEQEEKKEETTLPEGVCFLKIKK